MGIGMASLFNHDSGLVEVDGEVPHAPPALPQFDLNSSEPLPELNEQLAATSRAVPQSPSGAERIARRAAEPHQPGELWLQGDVLMCACPDCLAPMSIRVWLMVADCWNCGTSIELSEAQEREARRLLATRDASPAPVATAEPAPLVPPSSEPRRQPPADEPPVGSAGVEPHRAVEPAPPRSPAKAPPARTRPAPPAAPAQPAPPEPAANPATAHRPGRRVRASARISQTRLQRAKTATVTAWISDLFGMTPAWLVSLVFHLVLLTLLALLSLGGERDEPYITLSTTVSKETREGGEVRIVDPKNELAFDLPIPADANIGDQRLREALIQADQEARELRLDADAAEPSLPQLGKVKEVVGGGTGIGQALAARDPRIRIEMVKQEGGTTLTEAAVARGLRWLANHQNDDGSWSIDRFNRSPGCTCTRNAGIHSDAAGTSLALLPFLGAGQTHLVGRYQANVARGLGWLIKHQKSDGDLRADSQGNSGMYAHGQAAIVLCEAFYMTGDEELRAPAQKAIDFIAEAQHVAGGWRYRPGEAGDTSVVGWQLMALQSARAANLSVSPSTLELASQYLDSVSHHDGSRYSYQRGRNPDHVMTAEALLCRMYLGWTLDDAGLQAGLDYLVDGHLPDQAPRNIYYWYYGTQAMHHAGGPRWDRWNRQMREILVDRQQRRGHEAGSWDPEHQHDKSGGRLYATALAVCTLEVYYRHLPLFRQIKLD